MLPKSSRTVAPPRRKGHEELKNSSCPLCLGGATVPAYCWTIGTKVRLPVCASTVAAAVGVIACCGSGSAGRCWRRSGRGGTCRSWRWSGRTGARRSCRASGCRGARWSWRRRRRGRAGGRRRAGRLCSKAPMSQSGLPLPLPSTGRAKPRWSTVRRAPLSSRQPEGLPASIAGLSAKGHGCRSGRRCLSGRPGAGQHPSGCPSDCRRWRSRL